MTEHAERTVAPSRPCAVTTALLVLWCAAVGACGGEDNSLTGSIGASFSLTFDRVQCVKQGLDLRIEYVKEASGGTLTKVCKIVVKTDGLGLKKGKRIAGETFRNRVYIERVALTGGDFPDVSSGSIHFDAYSFRDGGRMDGEFEAIFENGRSLSGEFDAKVNEVSLE